MPLEKSNGLWGNFDENFDEVLEVCEISGVDREVLVLWKGGMHQNDIAEHLGMEQAKVRESVMIVFVKLRKHLQIPKSG